MKYCKNCKKETQHYLKSMYEFEFDTRQNLVCSICECINN